MMETEADLNERIRQMDYLLAAEKHNVSVGAAMLARTTDRCRELETGLMLIRRIIRNSRHAPNVIDSIDGAARDALRDESFIRQERG